jgi:hypothetical protein
MVFLDFEPFSFSPLQSGGGVSVFR